MTVANQFVAYMSVLVFALAGSTTAFRRKAGSLRWIMLLLACTIICELVAFGMSLSRQSNMPVYRNFAFVYLALLALYYNEIIPAFRKYRIGWCIAAGSVAAAVLRMLVFPPPPEMDFTFLLWEGIGVVAMALAAMFSFVNLDIKVKITGNIHFWLSLVFLVFWSSTFLVWTLLKDMVILGMERELTILSNALWAMNMITYAAIGTVFLLFHHKNKSEI